MSSPAQPNGKLVWRELLSSKEIEEWAMSREQPRKLWRVDGLSIPGVYRHSFDDFPARLLLENWAILHSERFEKMRPRNRDIPTGIHQGTKNFFRPAKGNIAKVGRHGTVIKRGGIESLL